MHQPSSPFSVGISHRSRCLTYARAGHDPPFLLRRRDADEFGEAPRPVGNGWGVRLLDGSGMALGLFPSEMLNLHEWTISLNAGDRLVLYTDGLTDARAPGGELFDRHRLQSVVEAAAAGSPAALCEAVFDAVGAFQGGAEPFDDMTMLVVGVGES